MPSAAQGRMTWPNRNAIRLSPCVVLIYVVFCIKIAVCNFDAENKT